MTLQSNISFSLENTLPVSASSFITDLRSLRSFHQLCEVETFGDYEEVLFDFKTNFEFLNEEFKLSMTLKIHVIFEHYSDYFQWTGKTMKYTNAEFIETAHLTFKMSKRIHKFKITRKRLCIRNLPLNQWFGITPRELVMSYQLNLG